MNTKNKTTIAGKLDQIYHDATVNGSQYEPTETPETSAAPDSAPASTPPPIAPPPLNPGAMNDDRPDWRDLWDDAAEINQIEMGAYWTVDDITSPALCLRLLEEDNRDLAPALRRRYLALTD